MGTIGQQVKSVIRSAMAEAFYRSQVHRLCDRGRVLILTYHRVLSPIELRRYPVQSGMYVLDQVFERHMQYLRETFDVLSFADLLSRWRERRWDDGKRYCVITFDDGWLDNYQFAFPVLKKYGVPATVFLPTDFIGSDRWFWPDKLAYLVNRLWESRSNAEKNRKGWNSLNAVLMNQSLRYPDPNLVPVGARESVVDECIEQCKRLPPDRIESVVEELASVLQLAAPDVRLLMGWDEVNEMSRHQITFGSHSCSHRLLTNISLPEVRVELETSLRILKERAVNLAPVFCYPNGNTNQAIQALVRECGYQAAVGVEKGSEGREPGNLYHLPRVSIHNDITANVPLFAFHVLGPMN